ncbi:transposase [Desulfocurvibacter africanus]|uniref:transposase n=1 Tax=Desulfocurvibacter africanus TaxID=873 RepID=UPI00041752A7|nr:transposase [Desulfocurvibacter africanus]
MEAVLHANASEAKCAPERITRASATSFFRALRGIDAVSCPRCGQSGAYALRDGRFRCRGCRYTFHEYAGTWLDRVKLPPEYWLTLLRYFAEGLPVEDMAQRLGLSYATAYKACHTVRLAILAANSDEAALLLDERGEAISFCPNVSTEDVQMHCVQCRSPVFHVTRDNGQVRVRLFALAKARDVFSMDLPLKCWRTLLYTGPFRGHEGLIFSCCKRARGAFGHRFVGQALPLDRAGGFMEIAETWMARYHCLSPQTYYLYLKEIELRCNCRDQGLLSILARMLMAPVSNSRD